MTDMTDNEDELGGLYRAEKPLPPTPTEEIWSAVRAELPPSSSQLPALTLDSRPARTSWPAWKWAAAAGVVLAVGVGIGRTSVSTPAVAVVPPQAGVDARLAVDPPPSGSQPTSRAFDAFTRNRIADLEPLLTMIAVDAGGGRYDPQVGEWAKAQLNRTRLALDSPGAADPNVRSVLQDLELILMQVASLAGVGEVRASQEMGLIAQALEDQGLLERVRAMGARGP